MKKVILCAAAAAAMSLPNYRSPAQAVEVVYGMVATMAIGGTVVLGSRCCHFGEVAQAIAPDAAEFLQSGSVSPLLQSYFDQAVFQDKENGYGLFPTGELSRDDKNILAKEVLTLAKAQ